MVLLGRNPHFSVLTHHFLPMKNGAHLITASRSATSKPSSRKRPVPAVVSKKSMGCRDMACRDVCCDVFCIYGVFICISYLCIHLPIDPFIDSCKNVHLERERGGET